MGNKQEHETNRHFQIMAWFPEYEDALPKNPTIKDEMRNVVWHIGYDSLKQTYDEIPKLSWAFRKIKKYFP